MQKINLEVTFDRKEEFKLLCKRENIPYFWNKEEKTWGIEVEGAGTGAETALPKVISEHGFQPNDHDGKKIFHVIDCDYTYMPFASKEGAKWDPKRRVAVFRGKRIPTGLTGFEPKPFSHQAKMERELNAEKEKVLKATKEIIAYKHQEESKNAILEAWKSKFPGFLLADSTGLGKSISTWLSVLEITKEAKRPLKILVSGPLNALETWRETILWMGNGNVQGNANEITIINYDRFRNLFEEEEKKSKSLKGIAKFGSAEHYDIIIFDESHYLKNPTSARTKLARKLEEAATFIIWISATAGQNPLELSYLSNLLAHLTGHKKGEVEKEFEKWCQLQGINVKRGTFGKWTWDPHENDNQKLHKILFSNKTAALRRRCTDIEGWPEIQRIPKTYEFSPEEKKLYETEWKEFLKAHEEDKLARLQGKKETAKGLAQLVRLRQKASLLRIEKTGNQAEELLENGYQVAIAVEFLKTLDALKENLEKRGYNVVEYSGRNTKDREGLLKKYQMGEAEIIIFSTESSLNLHQEEDRDKPRAQINHDLRWSGIEQEQVDGRSHRNGRFAPVYWCYTKNTIEERVATILLKKLEGINTLHGETTINFKELYGAITSIRD